MGGNELLIGFPPILSGLLLIFYLFLDLLRTNTHIEGVPRQNNPIVYRQDVMCRISGLSGTPKTPTRRIGHHH